MATHHEAKFVIIYGFLNEKIIRNNFAYMCGTIKKT
jgi:hypothetical protein